ncbi:MAG: Mut7-C RNAse domain-containing protein [Mycobacteriales bacterium]
MVWLQVAQELRLFLPVRCRSSGVVETRYDGTASLGHLVQAAGVPLTEAGGLCVDGRQLTPGVRPGPQDVVEVLPRARPQPLDGPPALLLDVHLGALARRLRLLGVDTAYRNDADDAELVAQAGTQDRLLLTQDRGLLMRRALRRAAYVRGEHPDTQLADVLGRFRLPLSPYALCPVCGAALRDVAKADVLDRLEPGTRRTQHAFRECGACGRVSWKGAHAGRIDALVSRWT